MANYTRNEYEIWSKNEATRYIYTHRSIQHFPMDSAIAEFQKQKEEGYSEMRQRYKNNYLQSISSATGEAARLLNLAMSEDEAMDNFDKTMTDALNENFSNAIKNVSGYSLEQSMQNAYKSVNECINKKDASKLNILLEEIKKAADLLKNNGNELVILLNEIDPIQNMADIDKLYYQLKSVVKSLEGKAIGTPNSQLLLISNQLKEITGKISGGASIGSLNGHLRNLFSLDLGEYIVSKGILDTVGEGIDDIAKTLTGSSTLNLEGAVLDAWKNHGSRSLVYKTDNSFQNINIDLNDDGDSVKLSLGLSTKWYKTLNSSNGVSIGKEVSFLDRVDQIFSTVIGKYYAYNSLTLVDQNSDGYKNLKSAIIAKNLDALISGLGYQGDFSQYLVVNGKFYSIWEIIQSVKTYNTGGSGTYRESSLDPITVSAEGLSGISKLTQDELGKTSSLEKAYARVKQQNEFLRTLGLHGKFYPHRLASLSNK